MSDLQSTTLVIGLITVGIAGVLFTVRAGLVIWENINDWLEDRIK